MADSSEPMTISCQTSDTNLPSAPTVTVAVTRGEYFHYNSSPENNPHHIFDDGDWMLIVDVKDSKR